MHVDRTHYKISQQTSIVTNFFKRNMTCSYYCLNVGLIDTVRCSVAGFPRASQAPQAPALVHGGLAWGCV